MASYTYTAVGNREDLIDIITNISPDKTPLYSSLGKTTATAMVHEWLTDSLEAPAVNKHLEDAEFETVAAVPRVRIHNHIQIFMKGAFVTDSQEAVKKAGIQSEMAYQIQKAMKVIALDVEKAILTNASATAGTVGVAGEMGGIAYWNSTANNSANEITASSGPLTEDLLNDAIQAAWVSGGSPNQVIVSGDNKRIISGFTAGAVKNRDMSDKTLINVVDTYDSDKFLVA